jgi:hypothetical protein
VIAISQPHGRDQPTIAAMAGILGAEILSQFDLDMDLPNRTLTLYRVDGCAGVTPAWQDAATIVLPVKLGRSGRPQVAVELDGKRVTAIFDSGASATLLSPAADGTRREPTRAYDALRRRRECRAVAAPGGAIAHRR